MALTSMHSDWMFVLPLACAFVTLSEYFNSPLGVQYVCMARAHKNGRLEEERVTPIEARSPGKIIEPY